MSLKQFFKNSFQDMKNDAKAQHEVDKANFQAVKAESKANLQKAKAMSNPENFKKAKQAEREILIKEANDRKTAAENQIE